MTKELSTAQRTERTIQLLAAGSGIPTIARTLREEGYSGVSHTAVHRSIQAIMANPVLSQKLDVERRAVSLGKIGWLTELAEKNLERFESLLQHFEGLLTVEGVGNPKTLDAFAKISNAYNSWWKNVSELHGAIKKEQVNVNLTQVNIGQVNAVNGQLLTILQDVMRWLPQDRRNHVLERVAELERSTDVLDADEFK